MKRILRFLITIGINFGVGIIGMSLVVTQLSGMHALIGSLGSKKQIGFDVKLDLSGIVAWLILIFLYFYAAKTYLGKSFGGKIADLLFPTKTKSSR